MYKCIGLRKGFTLIELLVVIAIIALLAGIIMASLTTARQKSRDSKRIADIKNIELALSLYYNDNYRYPVNIYASGSGTLIPTYLSSMPTDPSYQVTVATCATAPTTAGCYPYAGIQSGSSCTSFHLGANLEQIGNTALTNDFSGTNPSYTAGTVCTGSLSGVVDFTGANSASCRSGGAGYCYDVHP
jgi:prepilin-type N-terminal cleavage/methylation domain-containing protein